MPKLKIWVIGTPWKCSLSSFRWTKYYNYLNFLKRFKNLKNSIKGSMCHLLDIYQTKKGSMCGDTSFFRLLGTCFFLSFDNLPICWHILPFFVELCPDYTEKRSICQPIVKLSNERKNYVQFKRKKEVLTTKIKPKYANMCIKHVFTGSHYH